MTGSLHPTESAVLMTGTDNNFGETGEAQGEALTGLSVIPCDNNTSDLETEASQASGGSSIPLTRFCS